MELVESLPVGDFSKLPSAPHLTPTHTALTELVDATQKTLDLTAMYIDLLGTEDRAHYSPSQMQKWGADRGLKLFDALVRAAKRGVALRMLLGTLNSPLNSTEVVKLSAFPNVQVRQWDPKPWYGGGIMHAKVWLADAPTERAAFYVGSANSDWKSLAQIQEIGVLSRGNAELALDARKVFDAFWSWAQLHPGDAGAAVASAWSPSLQATLAPLPAWDPNVAIGARASSPFADAGLETRYSLENPMALGNITGESGFLSASPGGVLLAARTPDEDALVYTIRSASSSLCLSVMDFLPGSAFSGGHGGAPIRWNTLVDAILAVAYAKPVRVRLLFSRWMHTDERQRVAIRRLAGGLAACEHDKWQPCRGSLEVREFMVPGWNDTSVWPPYTRVNHAKYIVTDQRLNVATSNFEWGYVYNTAGMSLNSNVSQLRASAQAVFDADWDSPYATPVEEGMREESMPRVEL